MGKKGVRASEGGKRQLELHNAAKHASKDHADQVQTIVLLAQAVSEDSPAKSSNQPDLLEYADGLGHISHESSSICGRSGPSLPTIERQICSSVFLLPSSPE